jgi:hypothetical protein
MALFFITYLTVTVNWGRGQLIRGWRLSEKYYRGIILKGVEIFGKKSCRGCRLIWE